MRRLAGASPTLPLHQASNPRMYDVLTANTPGCVAFSLPVQRRNLRSRRNLRLSRSLHSQRCARLTRRDGFEPERRPVPGNFQQGTILLQGRFKTRQNRISGPGSVRYAMAGERFGAAPGLQRSTRRSILPPTCSDGPTLDAPDCVADQDPRNDRADAKRKLRASSGSGGSPFGAAPRFAFWPSPHPRIRWTVASPGRAIRARLAPRPPPSRVPKCPTRC